jgi:ATP-dependent protease ClpP protease subunit/phenylpyruvate tautomerase PptA (4-oxalocrotonate tautomerase family)
VVNKFKFIDNVSNGIATINLYEQIGDTINEDGSVNYGISGSSFANAIQWLDEYEQVSSINIRINSIGGSVLDGYSMCSAILNCNKPVNTFIDGLAASTAGWVAVCGKKVSMANYGTFMMHNPSGGTDKDVTELVKNTIVTILTNRTGMSAEECSKLMNKETWMNAQECKDKLIVDEIISYDKKIKMSTNASLYDMALIYNKVINKPKMENIKNKLSLGAEATEIEIVNAIEVFQNKVTALEAEKLALTNKVAEFEAKEAEKVEAEKAAFVAEVTEVIETAVKEDKIKAEEKESVLANALSSKENFAFVKNMLDKISNVVKSPVVFDIKNVKSANGLENRETWTCRDWEKKDPSGLLKLKNEAPAVYTMLYKAEYGVEPTV